MVRARRHRRLRRGARVPRRDLGAVADDRGPRGARVHARGAVRGALRRAAPLRAPRLGRLDGLRGDARRDRARGAGRGRDAPAPRPRAGRSGRRPPRARLGRALRRDAGGRALRARPAARAGRRRRAADADRDVRGALRRGRRPGRRHSRRPAAVPARGRDRAGALQPLHHRRDPRGGLVAGVGRVRHGAALRGDDRGRRLRRAARTPPCSLGALLVVVRRRSRSRWSRSGRVTSAGIGIAFALGGAALFALRDNLVRHVSLDTRRPVDDGRRRDARREPRRDVALRRRAAGSRVVWPARSSRAWLLPGTFVGLSYIALFEAFYRGTVSVVAPIVATESLFGVVVLRAAPRADRSGSAPRLVAGRRCWSSPGGAIIAVVR